MLVMGVFQGIIKKKLQKICMLKKLVLVAFIKIIIFKAHFIKSGRISFLLSKFPQQ